jgi:hypothetical protein
MVFRMAGAEAQIDFGISGEPVQVFHPHGPLWWLVYEVVCRHGRPHETAARPGDVLRMRVWGSLPANPRKHAEFVMEALGTGRWPWWSIGPATGPCSRCGSTEQL